MGSSGLQQCAIQRDVLIVEQRLHLQLALQLLTEALYERFRDDALALLCERGGAPDHFVGSPSHQFAELQAVLQLLQRKQTLSEYRRMPTATRPAGVAQAAPRNDLLSRIARRWCSIHHDPYPAPSWFLS